MTLTISCMLSAILFIGATFAVLQPLTTSQIRQHKSSANFLDEAIRAFVRDATGANSAAADGDVNNNNNEKLVPSDVSNATQLWAVLVAGSNTWWNYRHQADVCHAYQIMKRHGIPDERIIVMMYDDLAFNEQNPTPGVIINKPNGTDVYHGVLKDYKGDDVTPQNFLNVIQGHSAAVADIGSAKVLKSGPNDHVFINFADHGGPGLIAFPNDVLYAQDLMNALDYMSNKKMFKKLVLYIEACESGSMFDKILPANIDVYAATASNPDESSYACYYDELRGTYLGDVFSVNWMENSDANNIEKETILVQINDVKNETTTSHVMHYGDNGISRLDVGQFQGLVHRGDFSLVPRTGPRPVADAVPSPDVPKHILAHRVRLSATDQDRQQAMFELDNLQLKRSMMRNTVEHIVSQLHGMTPSLHKQIMNSRQRLTNRKCATAATEAFRKRCYDFSRNEYALRMVPMLVNACELGVSQENLVDVIVNVCHAQRAHLVTGVL